MANVNKVILIGRLTRDPETRTFASGGKVVNFGFAVTNRRKNQQSGQWEDYPMFIDCKAFNRGEFGKTADLIEQYLSKGKQVFLEGKLDFEQWEDKNGGGKRSKHVLIVDNVQFLEPRQDGAGSEGGTGVSRGAPARSSSPAAARPAANRPAYDESGAEEMEGPAASGSESEIPF
jgi:single-strand DNA-binding protein